MALQVLQDGLHADPGDLPEDQASLVMQKLEGLIRELEKLS
jgi:hypothetical protein